MFLRQPNKDKTEPEALSLITKDSSVTGKRHICVLNFKQKISFHNETIFFPPGHSPNLVSFLEVGMRRIQNFSHPMSNNGLPISSKIKPVNINPKKKTIKLKFLNIAVLVDDHI
jgi:hypothetical protein